MCISTRVRASLSLLAVMGLILCSSPLSPAVAADHFLTTIDTVNRGWDAVKGPDGTLYFAFSDDSDLKIAISSDNGKTWEVQDPQTPHDGKLQAPVMTVDQNGAVFVACRSHAAYPGTPDVYVLGQMDVYCITNVTGSWTEELMVDDATYNSGYGSSNNTALPFAAFVDDSNKVHFFLYHYYWWSYGGKTYEMVRGAGPGGTWGSLTTAIHIYNAGADNQTRGNEAVVQTPGGGAAIFSLNPTSDYVYYVTRGATGPWSAPQTLAPAADYGDCNLDIDEDGHLHAVFMDTDYRTILYSKDWGTPESVYTLTGANPRCPYSILDAAADGTVIVDFRNYDWDTKTYTEWMRRTVRDAEGTWSAPQIVGDLVEGTTDVITLTRFDMWNGGSFDAPLQYVYNGVPSDYPISVYFWSEAEPLILHADMNDDGYVDHKDLMMVLDEWHLGTPPE